jgi:hypothetical protein
MISWYRYIMKSSQAVSHVNLELVSDIAQTVTDMSDTIATITNA